MFREVCLCSMLLLAARAEAGDRLAVMLSPEVSPHWFQQSAPGDGISAGSGEVIVLGELNLHGDAPSHTSAFRLLLPDNTACPLHIDQGTVVREFGKVVFFRFYATVPARLAGANGPVIEWDEGLRSPNVLVPGIQADEGRRADYREAVFAPIGGGESAQERQLDLKVVVDRQSSRYRLLYLLPILLVLAAAMVRGVWKFPPGVDTPGYWLSSLRD